MVYMRQIILLRKEMFHNVVYIFVQLICKQTPRFSIGDCAGGHRQDNRDKNRDVLIIPRKC